MDLVLLGLLGGVVAVDGVAAVQSMISRPLVVGGVAGLVVGDPALGVQIGVLLELYLLVAVPSGGGRHPEGGTGTIVAVAAAVTAAASPAAIGVGVASGLAWGLVAGESQLWLRRWNERTADRPGHPLRPGDVGRAQAVGLAAEFGRGTVVTLVGLGLGRVVGASVGGAWPLPATATVALTALGGLASLGILLRSVSGGRERAVLFGVGLTIGALVLGGA